MNDTATNHANANVTMTGLDLDITSSNNQGNTTNVGININTSGADNNYDIIISLGKKEVEKRLNNKIFL